MVIRTNTSTTNENMASQIVVILLKFALLISSTLHINAQSEQCFADIEKPYVYFGSKTSYHASRTSNIIPESCTPTYIWALIRHGTRYPTRSFMTQVDNLNTLRDEIITNHKEGRGKLCQKDVENLQKWNSTLTEDLKGELTPQGKSDLVFLAEKLKEVFPELLGLSSKDSFLFQSSALKRAKDSALAFTNELLGTNFTSADGNNITENENLLHVNKICPEFEKEVHDNPLTYKEKELFKKSNEMKNLISDVSTRLGYKQPLPYDSIELMYVMCAYETAWYLNSSPAFCTAFLPNDFQVLEYFNDLENYYSKGYGSSYSNKIGCVIVRDMMMSLDNAVKNPQSNRKGTFYFTHSEMIVPTVVKLNLFQDAAPLLHNNYEKMKSNRKWRLSIFDSFASNIIAVLYKCLTGPRNVVVFYQNERKNLLPKCTNNPCTLENIKQNFADVFNEEKCNLKFCHESEPLNTSSGYSIFLRTGVMIFCSVIAHFI